MLLDHDSKGNRRLPVTLVGKSPLEIARRFRYATGTLYQRRFQHVSASLRSHHACGCSRRQKPASSTGNYRGGCGANPPATGRC